MPVLRLHGMIDPLRRQILEQRVERALHRAEREDLMGFEIAEAALDRCPRVEIVSRARPEHDARAPPRANPQI